MRTLYSYGLPYSKVLDKCLLENIARVDINKASLIIIDGGVGEGKTTLAIHVCDRINKERGLAPVQLDLKNHPQYAMGGEDFLSKMRACYEEDLPAIIYDEAGDFNRRSALSRFNAMLNRTFETFRGFKIVVIVCLPCFNVLDQDIFDKNIPRLLIHCYDRTMSQGNIKAYSLFSMLYVRERMKICTVKAYAYSQIDCNLYGHFLNLPDDRARALDSISTKGKIDILKKSEVKIAGLIGYNEISIKLQKSISWVRQTVAKLKIKHSRVINKAKYFDEAVLNTLAEYQDEANSKRPNDYHKLEGGKPK